MSNPTPTPEVLTERVRLALKLLAERGKLPGQRESARQALTDLDAIERRLAEQEAALQDVVSILNNDGRRWIGTVAFIDELEAWLPKGTAALAAAQGGAAPEEQKEQ